MDNRLATVFAENRGSLLKMDQDGFFDVNVELVKEASSRDTAVIYAGATRRVHRGRLGAVARGNGRVCG